MAKFVIAPHMRLHEWVAEEKGYFRAEGLDYEFQDQLTSVDAKYHDLGDKVGAYQTFEKGRTCDVSGACHWTVNMAAAAGHGKLYAQVYSVSPCGIFVAPDSPIKRPEDLAGVPISVGYQSGSHYSTIEALDEFLKPDQIKLSFADGLLFRRLERLYDREVPAVSVFSGPYYFLESLGFRKIVDTSFMMAMMVNENADMEDVKKYFAALRRAQVDIDLHTYKYTHYYKKEMPRRFHAEMDVRRFGPGERLVYEPYTKEMYEATQKWVLDRGIFSDDGNPIVRPYDASVIAAAAE
jgi:ABC-type nitrate/sulfonate/bicarbonate transport system substrate-binding protein